MFCFLYTVSLSGAVACSQCKGAGVNSVDHFNGRFKAGGLCWLCRYLYYHLCLLVSYWYSVPKWVNKIAAMPCFHVCTCFNAEVRKIYCVVIAMVLDFLVDLWVRSMSKLQMHWSRVDSEAGRGRFRGRSRI